MKYLILGCNGMAGHVISLYLKEQGHEVAGFARKDLGLVPTIIGDAFNPEQLRRSVMNKGIDIIVNCIGILNQFAEKNKAQATYLNSYLPHFLADITKDSNTRVFHISTDCVFSGSTGGYTETSFRDGETFYDRSKALGELEDDKNLTLRNSIVGPDMKKEGIGLLNWFMQQSDTVNGYTKAMWTGQTTLQLAKTIEAAAQTGAKGLHNTVPDSSISKYELLQLFNKYLRNNTLIINPVDGVVADKSLKRTRSDFDYVIPDYETMVMELADWINDHKSLYPHYFKD